MFFGQFKRAKRFQSTPRTTKHITLFDWLIVVAVALMLAFGVYDNANADQVTQAQSPTPSAWQPTAVGLHITSRHSVQGYNDFNPGVYLRWANARGSGPAAGVYHNSERATSVWAGYTYSTPHVGPVSAAITLGAITGYQAARVLPLAVPSVALHQGPVAYRLTYVPKVEKRGAHALHLSLEWSF